MSPCTATTVPPRGFQLRTASPCGCGTTDGTRMAFSVWCTAGSTPAARPTESWVDYGPGPGLEQYSRSGKWPPAQDRASPTSQPPVDPPGTARTSKKERQHQ